MKYLHESIGRELMFIDGKWVESSDNRWIEVDDPGVKGAIAGEVPRATKEDVDCAVEAAGNAFKKWKKVPPRERGKIISKIGEEFSKQINDMAQIVSLETGNALRTNSTGEVTQVADLFTFYGGLASEIKGETIPFDENLQTLDIAKQCHQRIFVYSLNQLSCQTQICAEKCFSLH